MLAIAYSILNQSRNLRADVATVVVVVLGPREVERVVTRTAEAEVGGWWRRRGRQEPGVSNVVPSRCPVVWGSVVAPDWCGWWGRSPRWGVNDDGGVGPSRRRSPPAWSFVVTVSPDTRTVTLGLRTEDGATRVVTADRAGSRSATVTSTRTVAAEVGTRVVWARSRSVVVVGARTVVVVLRARSRAVLLRTRRSRTGVILRAGSRAAGLGTVVVRATRRATRSGTVVESVDVGVVNGNGVVSSLGGACDDTGGQGQDGDSGELHDEK